MCGETCKETREEAPRPVGEPASCLNCSNFCNSVCILKCIQLRKRALSSSLSQYNAARPASEWYGAASTRVIAKQHSPAILMTKPLTESVTERVENYSKNLTLVTLHKSEGMPFNQPVSTAWCSL